MDSEELNAHTNALENFSYICICICMGKNICMFIKKFLINLIYLKHFTEIFVFFCKTKQNKNHKK